MIDCKWDIESGWTAVVESDRRQDHADINGLLPDGVDVAELDGAENLASIPRVVFADLLRADEVCAVTDVRHIVFLFDLEELEENSTLLERHKVRALLDRKLLSNSPMVPLIVNCMIGRSKKLDLADLASESLTRRIIRSSADRDAFSREILGVISGAGIGDREAATLRLVIEELTTNALIHAFDEEKRVRYEPGAFESMNDEDRVMVEYELSDRAFILKVTDSAGSLDPDVVRARLHRQLSGEGLLDTGGRGFFLGFSIGSLFAVNIDPGKSTEVIMVYDRDHCAGGNALLINVPDLTDANC